MVYLVHVYPYLRQFGRAGPDSTSIINMYTSKILYQLNHNKFTYHSVRKYGSGDQWHNEDSVLERYNRWNETEWKM